MRLLGWSNWLDVTSADTLEVAQISVGANIHLRFLSRSTVAYTEYAAYGIVNFRYSRYEPA